MMTDSMGNIRGPEKQHPGIVLFLLLVFVLGSVIANKDNVLSSSSSSPPPITQRQAKQTNNVAHLKGRGSSRDMTMGIYDDHIIVDAYTRNNKRPTIAAVDTLAEALSGRKHEHEEPSAKIAKSSETSKTSIKLITPSESGRKGSNMTSIKRSTISVEAVKSVKTITRSMRRINANLIGKRLNAIAIAELIGSPTITHADAGSRKNHIRSSVIKRRRRRRAQLETTTLGYYPDSPATSPVSPTMNHVNHTSPTTNNTSLSMNSSSLTGSSTNPAIPHTNPAIPTNPATPSVSAKPEMTPIPLTSTTMSSLPQLSIMHNYASVDSRLSASSRTDRKSPPNDDRKTIESTSALAANLLRAANFSTTSESLSPNPAIFIEKTPKKTLSEVENVTQQLTTTTNDVVTATSKVLSTETMKTTPRTMPRTISRTTKKSTRTTTRIIQIITIPATTQPRTASTPLAQLPENHQSVSGALPTALDLPTTISRLPKVLLHSSNISKILITTTNLTGYKQEMMEIQPTIETLRTTIESIKSRSRPTNTSLGIPWPVKKEAIVEGDIVLGGLMMVHEREDLYTCGPVMPQGGIQALEAMLYTLDQLNKPDALQLLPNITLGAHILDDCDKDTYGLEMAVDFIKGSISNIDGAEYSCNKSQVRKVISGVVGAASSVTSIQVANLLRLFKIPQVSFFSTSPELSNKQRFEYFTRTIPSDHYQVKAMVDIVMKLGWSYVSIIYEESNYGIKAFEELEDLLGDHNVCIAIKEKLVKDSGVATETAYDGIVLKLLTKPRARGAIIFGSDQEVAGVMRAVRRNNATGSFSWIGSDGWSARSLVSDGNEAEVEGTLSVQPQANSVKGFKEYFLNLTVENNKRNPWFIEFWEHNFQCRYPNSPETPYNKNYSKTCSGKEELKEQDTVFEDQLQFVSDAVMAFAYAIREMHRELCKGRPGLCDAMKPTKGTELLQYLRKVSFTGLSGDRFHFDHNGDGPARYNIIHFKQTTPGKYKWIRVGEYNEGVLSLNMSEIQFKMAHPKPPESVCSLPCDQGQAQKYVEGERCCWHCFNCTQYQIRDPGDETQCKECLPGTVPDALHVECVDIPEEYLQPDSAWAIGAMAFSSTGILITMFVCGVFMRHNDTPVVRASGRELSYVLLAGIFMCYAVTYALVFRPSDVVCGIQRFGAGFCFTVVYAALLTKTNRISRIFNAGKRSAKRPSLISPRSQLIICAGLVGVQVLINAVWMVISPPKAIHHYPTREDNLLVCSSYIDASYMIAFTYPILLIVICTVYAVLTRKIPEAFNESKHIGFTMYTTCVIWLAFVPLYFGTANHVAMRITSMSVTISLSASVTVVCLFSPKLYIILIRPERNIRQSMMPMRYSAITKSTTVTNNSGPGSMMAAVTLTAATCNQKNQIQKHVPPGSIDGKDGDSGSKPEVKDSSTQTNGYIAPPPTSAVASNGRTTSPAASVATDNNNYNNGPILPLADIKGDL